MNLIIDIGNTFAKVAVFKNATVLYFNKVGHPALLNEVKNTLLQYPVKRSILCTTAEVSDEVFFLLQSKTDYVEMGNSLKLPFINRYGTPNTLGQDRIALAAAASGLYPGCNVLVIDAGTCITYDIVTATNEYWGGAITPGLQMRLQAMHTFTAKLPLLNADEFIDDEIALTGNSTKTSMISGVVNGTIYELEGFIADYTHKLKDLTVILTGGNSYFLSKRFKNGIFANSNFLLEGLNVILDHNKHE